AGLGSAWQIVVMFLMAFNVLAIGASIVITHHLGSGDPAGARRMALGAVCTNFWLGMVFSVLLAVCAPTLLGWAQLPPGLMVYALPFLQWMGGTLFLEAMNFALAATLRAHGHTREVLWVMLAQNVLNAALTAVLVFGLLGVPQQGVTGVALATVFSRGMACAALWWLARRQIGLQMHWRHLLTVPLADLRRLLSFGGPAVIENISWLGAYMLITALTARMGEQPLATQTYAMQIANVVMLFGLSVGLANEILIGKLVGAGELAQAHAMCLKHLKLGFIWTLVVAAVAAAAAPWLMGAFTADPVVVQGGVLLVMLGLVLEPGRSFNLILINALRASGDTRFPVLVGLCSQWGLMAFGAWALGTGLGWGLLGVWCAFMADEWVRGLLMLWRWQGRAWMVPARRAAEAARAADAAPDPKLTDRPRTCHET
ncbi:MATE family efflux transporter, partial [Ideonella sp.]|uniref:MATE family efflux transporter n=1 Tax=Ideonella sp. TaxID=1929293 RepID=UPI003BB6D23A